MKLALTTILAGLVIAGTLERADAEPRTATPTWLQTKVTTLRAERNALRAENRRLRRVLAHKPSVREAIRLAAITYGQSEGAMRALAFCESRFDPRADNPRSTASGLFQHLYPETWNTTPYAGESVWSPYASALAAAQMLSRGRRGEWVC